MEKLKETSIEEQIQQIYSEKEKIISSISALESAGIEAPEVLLNQISLLEKKEKSLRREEAIRGIKEDISFLAEKYSGITEGDLVFAVRIKSDGTIAVSGKSTGAGAGGDGGGKRSKYNILIDGKPYKSWAEAAREFDLFKPNTNLRPVVKKYLEAEGIPYTEEAIS